MQVSRVFYGGTILDDRLAMPKRSTKVGSTEWMQLLRKYTRCREAWIQADYVVDTRWMGKGSSGNTALRGIGHGTDSIAFTCPLMLGNLPGKGGERSAMVRQKGRAEARHTRRSCGVYAVPKKKSSHPSMRSLGF